MNGCFWPCVCLNIIMNTAHRNVRCLLAVVLLANWWILASAQVADNEIPATESIDHIYVLGPFDIPDGVYNNINPAPDIDGFQDRPRIKLWMKGTKAKLSGTDERLYGEAATQVLEMLGSNYHTVDRFTWDHELHRIGNGQMGGIVLTDGTIIGWVYEKGGLGYFDYDYDPDTERVAYWKPLSIDEEAPQPRGHIYRVRDCDK